MDGVELLHHRLQRPGSNAHRAEDGPHALPPARPQCPCFAGDPGRRTFSLPDKDSCLAKEVQQCPEGIDVNIKTSEKGIALKESYCTAFLPFFLCFNTTNCPHDFKKKNTNRFCHYSHPVFFFFLAKCS